MRSQEADPQKVLRPCPRCGMKLWPTAKVRPMRFHDLRHRDVKTTTGTYGHLGWRTCARRSTCFRRAFTWV